MIRNKGYKAQDIGLMIHSNNQNNIAVCNASLQ